MDRKIIIDLTDEALQTLTIRPEETPHAAAAWIERVLANDLNARGLADGGHVKANFFVSSTEVAVDAPSGWVQWSTDENGEYALTEQPADIALRRRVAHPGEVVDPYDGMEF
jgi:hypothetical protein